MLDDLSDELISYDWSADQAAAVVTFLEDLAEAIWSRYGFTIRGGTLGPGPPAEAPQLALPFPPPWEQGPDEPDDLSDDDIPW
jgi:hypothetical protein